MANCVRHQAFCHMGGTQPSERWQNNMELTHNVMWRKTRLYDRMMMEVYRSSRKSLMRKEFDLWVMQCFSGMEHGKAKSLVL